MNGVLDIIYTEDDQSTYKAIEVTFDRIVKRFDSGDITVDYVDYMHWIADETEWSHVSHLSSWEHFFQDGELYKELYVDHSNDNIIVTEFDNLSISEINKLIKYPVKRDISTFDELKQYYHTMKRKLH